MDLLSLLGGNFDCECGRRHELGVRQFVYESGAIETLPQLIQEVAGPAQSHRLCVVADVRTHRACGESVLAALRNAGSAIAEIVVPDDNGRSPVCDDQTAGSLKRQLEPDRPGLIVAVGSGVINDLCKWVSFEMGLPYVVVATAASMNGYAAANVAAKVDGLKTLIEARPPRAVVAEPAVIESAPATMTSAGFADTIAKFQSNADWLMSHLLVGEYYCSFCANLMDELEATYLQRPEDLQAPRADALRALFGALFWTGVAMTLVGTSTPASGGEHLLSHTLDMIADIRGHEHDLHGRQVGLGVLVSAALYERVLSIDHPQPVDLPDDVDAAFWSDAAVVDAIRGQYRAKKAYLEQMREKVIDPEAWRSLRTQLQPIVRSTGRFKQWLQRAGAAHTSSDIGCTRDQIVDAARHMHEIRKRCTIVDLAWLVGVLPDALDEIVDTWLAA